MKSKQLARLKAISLTLMLPGLTGLIVSAMISGRYLETMPQWPVPQQQRMVPRNIHGIVVYQTAAEDRRLDAMEFSSVAVFLAGLALGLAYLEAWGARQPLRVKDEKLSAEDTG
jgi:hypothetical protein